MNNLEYAAPRVRELTDEEIADLIRRLASGNYSGVDNHVLATLGFRCEDRACAMLMCQSCFRIWLDEEREEREDGTH